MEAVKNALKQEDKKAWGFWALDKKHRIAIGARLLMLGFAVATFTLGTLLIISTHGDNSHILLVLASFVTIVLSVISVIPPISTYLNAVGVSAADFILFALWLTSANTSAGAGASDTCGYNTVIDGIPIIKQFPWCSKGKAAAATQVVLVILHYIVLVIQFLEVHVPEVLAAIEKQKPATTLAVSTTLAIPGIGSTSSTATNPPVQELHLEGVIESALHPPTFRRSFGAGLIFAKTTPTWTSMEV